MLAEFNSPKSFWAEAVSTACHSSNRLYFRKKLNKTPYEIFTGNKPTISYFRVFGCKCYYLHKGVRLAKFQSKALEGRFVGYGAESHTYRVYDVSSRIVVETCSVEFKETNDSQVELGDACVVGDEIPQDAIGRMRIGLHRPIEVPLMANREEQCSTQVEPSLSQEQPAPAGDSSMSPTKEQDQSPPSPAQISASRLDLPGPSTGTSGPSGRIFRSTQDRVGFCSRSRSTILFS